MKVAKKLTAEQNKQLQNTLKNITGKTIVLETMIDPSILGGMIVQIGSRQVDTSLKTRLFSLKFMLKEAR